MSKDYDSLSDQLPRGKVFNLVIEGEVRGHANRCVVLKHKDWVLSVPLGMIKATSLGKARLPNLPLGWEWTRMRGALCRINRMRVDWVRGKFEVEAYRPADIPPTVYELVREANQNITSTG